MTEKEIEADLKRQTICDYVYDHPNLTAVEISEALELTKSLVTHHLRKLLDSGYVKREPTVRNGRPMYQFVSTGVMYFRHVITEAEKKEAEYEDSFNNLPDKAKAVARVIKLSDRNMQPPYRKGEKLSSRTLGIQSSMSLFNKF